MTIDKKNFRIDSTNWKEIIKTNDVKVKVNPEWDAWEYLEGKHKWEQLFTKYAAIRETKKAGKKLPASLAVFKDIIEKEYEWDYKDFLKWEDMKFCGWRDPIYERFKSIDKEFNIWCADGSNFFGNLNLWDHFNHYDHCGFSVRCVQDSDTTTWLLDCLITRCEENNIWIKKYEELKDLIIKNK